MTNSLILGLVGTFFLATITMPGALAVKSEINVSGNLVMNSELQAYQDNVMQAITKACLAQHAARETIVSVIVGPHGEIITLSLSKSGLAPDGDTRLMTALRTLDLGSAGKQQTDSLRITLDFDLAEVLAGARSTGTKIHVTGGSVTGPSFIFVSESDNTAVGVGVADVCDALTGGSCALSGP